MSTVHGLPSLSAPEPALIPCPQCGLRSEATPAGCPRCGAALPAPGAGAWREAGTLVALRDAELPDACVRCGAPGDGGRIRRRLYWHHPALYILLLWVIPYLIVALAVRRKTTLTMSVCAHHREVRRRALWVAWGLLGAAVAGTVAAIAVGSGLLGWLCLALFLAAPAVGIGGRRLVWVTRIDERLVRARGAGRPFMDLLPDWSAPGAQPLPPVAGPAPAYAPAPAETSWSSADVGDILARAWPELRADADRRAEYEWALDGLHPGVIEGVADSFAREGRPLPAPAMLRVAVLARTRAGAARSVPVATRPPAWQPAVIPRLGSRMRAGLVTAVAGVAALLAGGTTEQPWARVSGAGLHLDVKGTDVGGGPLVAVAAFAGLVCCIVLAVLVVRRSTLARLRIGFGLAAGAFAVAVVGALIGLSDVSSAPDQIAASLPSRPAYGVRYVVPDVAATGWLWTSLILSGIGFVAAFYGYLAMRRREEGT